MRPKRYVGERSGPALRRLMAALEPAVYDIDPFDPLDDWRVTTTEDDPSRPPITRRAREGVAP